MRSKTEAEFAFICLGACFSYKFPVVCCLAGFAASLSCTSGLRSIPVFAVSCMYANQYI